MAQLPGHPLLSLFVRRYEGKIVLKNLRLGKSFRNHTFSTGDYAPITRASAVFRQS